MNELLRLALLLGFFLALVLIVTRRPHYDTRLLIGDELDAPEEKVDLVFFTDLPHGGKSQ